MDPSRLTGRRRRKRGGRGNRHKNPEEDRDRPGSESSRDSSSTSSRDDVRRRTGRQNWKRDAPNQRPQGGTRRGPTPLGKILHGLADLGLNDEKTVQAAITFLSAASRANPPVTGQDVDQDVGLASFKKKTHNVSSVPKELKQDPDFFVELEDSSPPTSTLVRDEAFLGEAVVNTESLSTLSEEELEQRVEIPLNLPKLQRQELAKHFPNLELEPTGRRLHSCHLWFHVTRELMETSFKLLFPPDNWRRLVTVGGDARRNFRANPELWEISHSLRQEVVAPDYRLYEQGGPKRGPCVLRYCECEPEDCKHVDAISMLLCHRVAEYQPKRVASLCRRVQSGRVYAVEFQLYAGVALEYFIGEKPEVSVEPVGTKYCEITVGSERPYTVQNNEWLWNNNEINLGREILSWKALVTFQGLCLLEFRIRKAPSPWWHSFLPGSLVDVLWPFWWDLRPIRFPRGARGFLHKHGIRWFQCWGDYLFVFRTAMRRQVVIPIALFQHLRTVVAFWDRNQQNFDSLVLAGNTWMRTHQLVEPEAFRCCVVVAFVCDIEDESSLLVDITDKQKKRKVLTKLLNFEKPNPWLMRVCWASLLTFLWLYFRKKPQVKFSHPAGVSLLGLVAGSVVGKRYSAPPFTEFSLRARYQGYEHEMVVLPGTVQRAIMRSTYNVVTAPRIAPKVNTCRVVAQNVPIVYSDTCLHLGRTKEQYRYSGLTLPALLEQCRPKFGYMLLGPVIGDVDVCVYRSCICNEYRSLCDRALLDRGNCLVEAWVGVYAVLTRHCNLVPGNVFVEPRTVWRKRFPLPTQNALLKALDLRTHGVYIYQWARTKMFIKREITPIGSEGHKAPRAIQARYAEYNDIIGPLCFEVSKILRKRWSLLNEDGTLNSIVYAGGLSAEGLSMWMNRLVREAAVLCEIVFWEGDYSRWDAHLFAISLMVEFAVYLWLGMTRPQIDAFTIQFLVLGTTAHQIRYWIVGTRQSGVPNTSVGNSLLNGAAVKLVLLLAGCYVHWIIVHGDDFLAAIPVEYMERVRVVNREVMHALGLCVETAFYRRPTHVEFCSGRWYSSEDGYTYGPKPGRLLAKLFWSTTPAVKTKRQKEWIRGVALGLVKDTAHVPIVHCVMRRVLELTYNVKTRSIIVDDYKFHLSHARQPTRETYINLAELYQCSPTHLRDTESWLNRELLTPLALLFHPLLTRIASYDLGWIPRYGAIPGSLFLRILRGNLNWWNLFDRLFEDQTVEIGEVPMEVPRVCIIAFYLLSIFGEECVKKWGWAPAITFILMEWAQHGFTPLYIPTAIMHLGTKEMPLLEGYIAHLIWNDYAARYGPGKSIATQLSLVIDAAVS